MRILPLVALCAACGSNNKDPKDGGSAPDSDTDADSFEPIEPPDISVSTDAIDFGEVVKDCVSEAVSVQITNQGEGSLNLQQPYLSGDGQSAFQLDWVSVDLSAGGSFPLLVSFTPGAWRDYDVTLHLDSDDPDTPSISVDLSGVGVEGPEVEETFHQDRLDKLDVVFVVDNSDSMSEELPEVVSALQAFVQVLDDQGVDYHVALLRIDGREDEADGEFMGDWLTPDSPDPIGAVATQIEGTPRGVGAIRGLERVQAALSEPLISSEHAGFLREDAGLRVVFATDGFDERTIEADAFVSWLQGIAPDVEVSAICGEAVSGCHNFDTEATAAYGGLYIDVAEATGGAFVSICDDDLVSPMATAALDSAGRQAAFFLTETPAALDGMVVSVDGAAVDGWSYDSTDNALVFDGDAIPDIGADISVAFRAAGTCDLSR